MRKSKYDLAPPIMAILDGAGPLTTGEICDLLSVLGDVVQLRPVQHGRSIESKRLVKGTSYHASEWEVCPRCDCHEEVAVERRYMAPLVRSALGRLKYKGLVRRIKSPIPNNNGGHLWLREDQADDYYRSVLLSKT